MEFKVQKLYRGIALKDKQVFAVTFVAVFLAHAYRLLTYIPGHDSFYQFYEKMDGDLSGRWTATYACGISSYFDTQYLCGLLSLIYISLTVVVITKMMDIKNKFLCCLAGMIIGIYPSVVCTFTYMFLADGHFLAMLFSALAAWAFTSGSWKKRLAGSALLGFAIGIYQAYLSYTIVLLLIWLVKKLLTEDECRIGRTVFNMFYSGIGGCLIYIVGLQIALKGRKMYSYQGIGEATLLHSVRWYLAKVKGCYPDIFRLIIKDDVYANNAISYAVALFWILIFAILCTKCVILVKNRRCLNVLLVGLFLTVTPIGIYCMKFFGDATVYSKLMLQSAALLWIFAIVLLDNMGEVRIYKIAKEGLLFLLLLNIGNYIVGANISYLGFFNGYEKTYALFTRVVDRIEQLPDYESAQYLYVGGNIPGEFANLAFSKSLDKMTGVRYGIIPYSNTIYVHMVNQHIGGSYGIMYTQEEKDKVTSTKEYQEMPVWPAAGSVRMIENVIAVKLGE